MLDTKESTVTSNRRRKPVTSNIATAPLNALPNPKDARIDSRHGYAAPSERARKTLPERNPTAQNSPLARSEARLMTAAIGATTVVCGMLVFYLCAYAHIASLGMREAQSRVQLRQLQAQNETLLAEYNGLRNPQRILTAAAALKMQNIAPTVTYIDLSKQPLAAGPEADETAIAPTQDAQARLTASSTTTNNNSAAIKVADRGTTGEKSAATGDL